MNKQLQQTLSLSNHPCLTNVTGLYGYPFVRSGSVLEGYEFSPGPWMVLLSNMRPEEVTEDDPGTRKALIQFCPFCGAPLYPVDEVKGVPGAELKEEGDHGEKPVKGPVQAPANVPTHKPKA